MKDPDYPITEITNEEAVNILPPTKATPWTNVVEGDKVQLKGKVCDQNDWGKIVVRGTVWRELIGTPQESKTINGFIGIVQKIQDDTVTVQLKSRTAASEGY